MLTGKCYEELYDNFKWEIPNHYNIGIDVCDKWANDKNRLALIYVDAHGNDQNYSFWELKNLSNKLANTLRAKGIDRKDRVGILLPQCPETLISHIAIYKLGAVALQLLTPFGPDALEYRLYDSEAKAIITDKENLLKINEIRDHLPHLELIFIVACPPDFEFESSFRKHD